VIDGHRNGVCIGDQQHHDGAVERREIADDAENGLLLTALRVSDTNQFGGLAEVGALTGRCDLRVAAPRRTSALA